MKKATTALALGALLMRLSPASGAEARIETFTGSMNGWTNSGAPAWLAVSNRAQATFSASPSPQTSTLLTTGALFSAAFTGDYTAAGIALIGFKFRAEQVLPSVLTLRWTRESNGYFRNLQAEILSTGQWYQFHFLMTGKEAGGWDGDPESLFTNVLGGVDTLAIAVTKPATVAASTFMVDDVFIDLLPAATLVTPRTGATIRVRWDHLLTNIAYDVETCTQLTGAWSTVGTLDATNRQQEVDLDSTDAGRFWRLSMP